MDALSARETKYFGRTGKSEGLFQVAAEILCTLLLGLRGLERGEPGIQSGRFPLEEDMVLGDVEEALEFLNGLGQGLVLGIAEALPREIGRQTDPNRVGIRFKRMIANIWPTCEGSTGFLILPRRADLKLSVDPARTAGAIYDKMEISFGPHRV